MPKAKLTLNFYCTRPYGPCTRSCIDENGVCKYLEATSLDALAKQTVKKAHEVERDSEQLRVELQQLTMEA